MKDIRIYDTAAIRNAASTIDTKAKKFKQSSETINNIVTAFQNWDDDVNTGYVARCKSELKPTMANVSDLMDSYSKFLVEAAEAIEKYINDNKQSV